MDSLYYSKYKKYKNKYLYTKQFGGINRKVLFTEKMLSHLYFRGVFGNTIIKIFIKQILGVNATAESFSFEMFTNFFGNNNRDIYNAIIENKQNFIVQENNIGTMIFGHADLEDSILRIFNWYMLFFYFYNETPPKMYEEYIPSLIKTKLISDNLYFSIAPGYNFEFYLPQFILDDASETNKYDVVIVFDSFLGDDGMFRWYNTIKGITERIEKLNIGNVINFIFLQTILPINEIQIMTNFLTLIKARKKNICHIGINSCGLLFSGIGKNLSYYDMYKNYDDYIFVGCDGVFKGDKYKKTETYKNHLNMMPYEATTTSFFQEFANH